MSTSTKKHVTINTIAAMADTSKTTVSFFLNGKTERMSPDTQERIRCAIEQTGYAPSPLARSLNAKKTSLIGVIICDITNTFSNQIVKGIESIAAGESYRVLVSSSNHNCDEERAYIDRLLAVGVDGFIVQPTAHFKAISTVIEDAGKPLVFFDSKFYDLESNWVKTNSYRATYEAILTCIQRGYERFLLVAAPASVLSSREERNKGFTDALKADDLGFIHFSLGDDTVDTKVLKQFFHAQIDGTTPTLVFVPNCWALPDVYVALRDFYQLMPQQLGLLGFDNTEWIDVASPSVSAIVQPAFDEGAQACRILLDRIDEQGQQSPHQELPCSIKWGETTR